jgi:hypothetical protein
MTVRKGAAFSERSVLREIDNKYVDNLIAKLLNFLESTYAWTKYRSLITKMEAIHAYPRHAERGSACSPQECSNPQSPEQSQQFDRGSRVQRDSETELRVLYWGAERGAVQGI